MSDQTEATSSVKNKQKSKKLQHSNTQPSKISKLFSRRSQDQSGSIEKHAPMRTILVDTKKLPQLPSDNQHFITNRISTTKYTLQYSKCITYVSLSFLPKALMIQFMRVSNIYFLVSAVLCFIPVFSPLPGYSALSPLLFVLWMSMMREAYEDFVNKYTCNLIQKRRTNDRLTNNKKCHILRLKSQQNLFINNTQPADTNNSNSKQELHQNIKGVFKESLWSEVKCGDILFLEDGEQLPADVIIFTTSAENGECFVQTSTLDGERTLKHKQCLVPIQKALEKVGLNGFESTLHCEAPNKNLYDFNGFLESEQLPEAGTISLSIESKKRTITLDSKQIALRGSNLANTSWAIGAVIYTGKESKLMQNYGQSRFKQSKIEKVVNMICIYLIVIQAILCLIMSIYSGFFTSNNSQVDSGTLKRRAEYLFYTESQANVKSLNGTDTSDLGYSPTLTGVITYGSYYILLNSLIPISLVVSIEFVKLIQTSFIAHDLQIYDAEQMKQAQPISMTLHEELAQVKYIFADKTGTLTANIMQFKACTIGSVCYDEEYNEEDYEYEIDRVNTMGKIPDDEENKVNDIDLHIDSPTGALVMEEFNEADGNIRAQQYDEYKKIKGHPFNEPGQESRMNRRNSVTKIMWNFTEAARIIKNLLETKKYFINEEINLGRSQSYGRDVILRKQNEYLHQFWLNAVLCHDVIATKHHNSDQLAYQGQSPDEITLLDAAKEIGYMFIDRTSDTLKVEIFGKPKIYRLLQKIEFTSDRKKMTVVVKDEDTGLIILFSKGADLAIFDRLSTQIEQHFLDATKEDLIKFSTKGFRTLCFAMRILDETFFYEWQDRYENAKLNNIKIGALKTKGETFDENLIATLQYELESNFFLLGATALEDKLQEGVPECIEDFHNAGIKVWMLTGDKLETAENIGFSSKMFNEKMYIFKLQTSDKNNTRSRLQQIDQKIQDIEKANETPIIGTQFILNPNAASDYGKYGGKLDFDYAQQFKEDNHEARNIIRALEEFKHESRASEYTINDSWARKPALRRKLRQRLEEIVPDRGAIVDRLIKENQLFYKSNQRSLYIPQSFDMTSHQYIVRSSNIYRSAKSAKAKAKGKHTEKETVDTEDQFGILVEGQTLQYILDSEGMKSKFLKILGKCQAVIVCRASPAQKGLVVQMIKESEPQAVTLAIGDGANDVNMLQKAHIGVGIFGKEGYQAAGNSDYAIGQFQYLRTLLFKHGRWSGVRLTMFMLFVFNKNLIFTLPQFWFGWFNGFSGQTFLDDAYITMYNAIITAVAVCTIAIWDQDINFENKKGKELLDLFLPQIYKESLEKDLFNKKKFIAWAAISILQSIFVFGIPHFVYSELIFDEGREGDLWASSTCSYFAMVLIHYFLVFAFTQNWTVWMLFMYTGSFAFFPGFIFLYDLFNGTAIQHRLYEIVFLNGYFILVLTITICVCILPVIFYYQAQSLLFPTLKDLIIQDRLNYDQIMMEADPKKAKAAHEMFKQQQQQVLLQWQQDYQNFNINKSKQEHDPEQSISKKEASIVKEMSQKIQESPIRKTKSIEMSRESPKLQISRKGLSSYKYNSQAESQPNIQLKKTYQSNTDLIENINQDNDEDIESARSENFLNHLEDSRDDDLQEKVMSYMKEIDNDHKRIDELPRQKIQVPFASGRPQPSKDHSLE